MKKTISEQYPKFKIFFDNPQSTNKILIKNNPIRTKLFNSMELDDQLEFLHLLYLWTIENRLFKEYEKTENSSYAEHYEIEEIGARIIRKEISLLNRMFELNYPANVVLQYLYKAKTHLSTKKLKYTSGKYINKLRVFIDSQIDEYEFFNKYNKEELKFEKLVLKNLSQRVLLLYVTGIIDHLKDKYPQFKNNDSLFASFISNILNISDKDELKAIRAYLQNIKNNHFEKGPITKAGIKQLRNELIKFDIKIPDYGFNFDDDLN